MKKLIAFILSVVSVVITAFALVGCTNNETLEDGEFYTVTEAFEKGYLTREQVMSIAYYYNNGRKGNENVMSKNYTPLPMVPERLSKTTDQAMKDSFYSSEYWEQYKINHTKEEIWFNYFGTYGNTVASIVNVGNNLIEYNNWEEKIEDITLYYWNNQRILIWIKISNLKNEIGENGFYTVAEAYWLGYITREDLMSIAYYHNCGRSGNEEVMGEDYKPLPKTPEKLSVETEVAVKQSYFDGHLIDKDLDYLEKLLGKKLEINVNEYDGTYNGCVAVMMSDNYSGFLTIVQTIEIDGIKFYYGNSNEIKIWKK